MTGWLLDTNVLSELAKPAPAPAVIAFLGDVAPAFVSTVSLHELRFGIERLPDGRRKEKLRRWLAGLETHYATEIIAIAAPHAAAAAHVRAAAARRGRTVHLADGLIAGTALHHDLVIATRNVGDFAELAVSVVDPWTAGATA